MFYGKSIRASCKSCVKSSTATAARWRPGGTTNDADDIDIAVFSDIQANYTIEGADFDTVAADIDGDGYITVTHVPVGGGGGGAGLGDGIDRLRNIEFLQFANDPILNLNSPPTGMDILPGPIVVTENVAGAILGTVIVHDPNPGDTFTFTIDDGRFEIVDNDPADGQQLVLKLKDGISLDYEEAQQVNLVIEVFDQGPLPSTHNPYNYTVNVTDVVFENLGPVNGMSIRSGLGAETLGGGALDDIIEGGAGADRVFAGSGNDRFMATVGDGNDRYDGGGGIDTYDLSQTSADSNVNLARGRSSSSETGSDILVSIENVVGSLGNNRIVGNGAANVLDGMGGNDNISGGGGVDTLFGGAGIDTLSGGAGNDILIGGAGNDIMNGNAGLDTFVFADGFGNDTIRGFDANVIGGQDLLDIWAFGITKLSLLRSLITGPRCQHRLLQSVTTR